MPSTDDESDLWIFGYGSVIWKNTDIPHTQSATVFVQGFKRRFWQGSTDHRGTPEAPGRVVSLYSREDFDQLRLSQKDANELGAPDEWRTYGVAFRVTPAHRKTVCLHTCFTLMTRVYKLKLTPRFSSMRFLISMQVLDTLEYREKDGYVPVWVPLYVPQQQSSESGDHVFIKRALTYIAPVTNSSFLGFATHEQIAAHVAKSVGPSGSNLQYITNLHHALVSLGHPDMHIASILSKLS